MKIQDLRLRSQSAVRHMVITGMLIFAFIMFQSSSPFAGHVEISGHCDSPRTTSKHSTRTSRTPAPSPTESVGCTLHVDHWHCSGPATTHHHSTQNTTTTMHHHNGHKTSSHKDPGPSPPGSVGCTPHGDHWHCSGPAMSKTTMGGPAMGAPATSVPATSVTAMDLPATMTSNPTGAFTGGAALINNARLDQFAAVMGGVAAIMMW
ncbi:hypothetical protein PABG_00821 [Paracoccidioides brasiliensis Pb03]|nr:hypothetical protein PABG_00821 [Paracoccidioides brasiliensis Pb03]